MNYLAATLPQTRQRYSDRPVSLWPIFFQTTPDRV